MPTPGAPRGLLAFLLACAAAWLAAPAAAVVVPPGFVVENVAPGALFDTPTGMAFLPDGRILVAEKRGRVYAIKNGVKHPTPLWAGENEVLSFHDRGLLDVAVDPDYAANRFIYLLYTVDPNGDGNDDEPVAFGRLTRYRVSATDSNVVDPASRAVLMGAIWREGPCIGSPSHSIGSLRWGADGSLLVSAGDGADYYVVDDGGLHPAMFGPGRTDPLEDIGAFRSQYLGSLAGKILRIDPATGRGYPSNPYYDGDPTSVRSRVWAYGLRNPFRFAVKPGTGSPDPALGDPGVLYVGDVGWYTWEEINVATQPGQNFGWPCYEGMDPSSGYPTADPDHSNCGSIGTAANPAPARAPVTNLHHSTASRSTPPGVKGGCSIGGAFYTGTLYPSGFRNRYFFADFVDHWIKILITDANDRLLAVQDFATFADGPACLAPDPVSGDLFYVSVSDEEVRRIRYVGGGANTPPVAIAAASPRTGVAPLAVEFSSAGSHDPDGDAITTSWLFGDLAGSAEANPRHTYAAAGVFRAVLTVEDGRGGVARDTVTVWVSDGTARFPTTGILDDFNRPDGPIGGAWVGDTGGLSIRDSALVQTSADSWTVWSGGVFGPMQEAYVTLDATTASAPEHDLMLKVQGLSWSAGEIEVRYDAVAGRIYVATYTPGPGWQQRGSFPIALEAGDQLGARAGPDGVVEVFVNGASLGTASVAGWPYAALGGRLGLTLVGASRSRIDDFGGGDVVLNPNTAPRATILSPASGTFYASGDTIRLSGAGTDAEDPADSLSYRWQVDLHHNVHVHPGVYVFDVKEASFVAEDHDDGTGSWHRARFRVTDRGGLRDTATADLFPEIDLDPSPVTVEPDTPRTASPALYRFEIRNRGRMRAPFSRWMLRAGGIQLAAGDTLVPGRDSVTVAVTVPPLLAAGTHDLRVVTDTLGAVRETDETNNARTRPLTVTESVLAAPEHPLAGLWLSSVHPNPSAGSVAMSLDLPRAARVAFAVYDLQGREVWREPARLRGAGRWRLEWAGAGGDGDPAPPGLYLARVGVGGRTLTRRIALIR